MTASVIGGVIVLAKSSFRQTGVSNREPLRMDRITSKPFAVAEHWRQLADAARRKGARISSAQTRQMILNVAETYDRLAEKADWKEPPSGEPSG